MFFEGTCKYIDLPETFHAAMTSIPSGETTPLWQMVSSNIGNTISDNGYVFHSKGSEGKHDIYVGLHKAFYAGGNTTGHSGYHQGWRFFKADGYTPAATADTNGTFENYVYNGMPLAASSYNYRAETLDVKYLININKDRVILYVEPVTGDTNFFPNMMWAGRPEAFDSRDTEFNILGFMRDERFNYHSNVRASGDQYGVKGIDTTDSVHYDVNTENNRLNGVMLPATIYLGNRNTYRGKVDMLVLPQDGTLRKKDTYMIGTKEYVGIEFPYLNYKYNNFSRESTTKVYLVPKF